MNTQKAIFISKFTKKIFFRKFCSFIETYFLTNENRYGRSLSLRRHTYTPIRTKLHHIFPGERAYTPNPPSICVQL